MKRNSLFVFALFITIALCLPQYAAAQSNVFQEGMASWYGSEFDGRPTASGEIFNSALFTAAHPSLPFGTFLIITNKQNNRQVTVKVNDRGPFVAGRIIDLSKAAAEHIDMIDAGTVPVAIQTLPATTLQSVGPPPPAPAPVPQYAPPAPEPAPAAAWVEPAVPVDPSNPYSYPPVTVNIYSTPQQPEPIQVQPQPQYDPYAQPWLNTQPAQPYEYYQPETVAPPAYIQPPPVYTPPPAYNPPPAYTPPPVAAPPPAMGIKLLPAITPLPNRVYRLQVGSYKVPRHAVDTFDKLKAVGLNPSYEPNGEFYRVVLARIPGTEVQSVMAKLEYAGFREALIREER